MEGCDLPTPRLDNVAERAKSKLFHAEVLCVIPNRVLDYIPGNAEVAEGSYAPKGDVDVGMTGVKVSHRYPIQLNVQLARKPRHQVASMSFEIQSLPKFWRDDHFEHSRVTGFLPIPSRRLLGSTRQNDKRLEPCEREADQAVLPGRSNGGRTGGGTILDLCSSFYVQMSVGPSFAPHCSPVASPRISERAFAIYYLHH